MFRLFVLLQLLLLNLLACKGGYSSCIEKVNVTQAIKNNTIQVPVTKSTRLLYSQEKPKQTILKADPFLGLYLVNSSKNIHTFDVNMRLQLGAAVVTNKFANEIKLTKSQIGLNTLGKTQESLTKQGLLLSSCCSLEGLATHEGLIEKEYINRFLQTKELSYADVGIRLEESSVGARVYATDPYMKDNPFQKGDILRKINGKRVKNAAAAMRKILFSKLGTLLHITLLRNGKEHTFSVKTHQRYGGGLLSDTFLESKGIYFDKDLRITKLSKAFSEYGLLVGDQLILVNGLRVNTQEELRRYIEDYKEFSTLLFERRHFQFFVNIK